MPRAAPTVSEAVIQLRSVRRLSGSRRHFRFRIDPTPPYAPQKKGKVESSVKYVKNSFFKPYATDSLDAEQLQVGLEHWVLHTAGRRIHGTTMKRPLEVFTEMEHAALLALPAATYQPVQWKAVKVHPDTHVQFDKALYSVPWRWVGQKAWVRAVAGSIQIYVDDVRVATHRKGRPGEHVTLEEHLPEGRRDLRHRSRSYWLERADRIGPQTGAFVREVFDSDDVLDQLRKVQAIVTHLETFPTLRAENASKRAAFYANYEYRAIKQILIDGLDAAPLPVIAAPKAASDDSPRYARNIQQMLELHMENADEPS